MWPRSPVYGGSMRKLSRTEPLPEMSFSPLRLFKFSFVFYMLFLFIVTYLFICSSMFDTRMTQRVTVVSFTVWTLCRSESSDAWQTSAPSVVTVPCFIITKINQIWSVFLFDLMNTEQLFSGNLSWRLKWVFLIEILRCPSSSFLS